ncbi:MBL fold metallo-hydrolase [Pseudanabaena sp. FACHB-2040]|uniref:MBL fold metallo-hydrolase n=1 Tax=Pseudanabaena sp. FACHB-2040 TaxID=2692859 RepID=UPI0018EFDE3E|nr:MBL fold metallo-hydrolase [Pseudanabaena sp. FACHB-2040]
MIIATSIMLPGITAEVLPGITAEKTAKPQVPGVYQFELGDFTITALSDGTVPLDLHPILTNTNQAEIDRLLHHSFLENPVEASINVFLIDTGDNQVLVDTGSGELFGELGGKLPMSLQAAGYTADEIDIVLITHISTFCPMSFRKFCGTASFSRLRLLRVL